MYQPHWNPDIATTTMVGNSGAINHLRTAVRAGPGHARAVRPPWVVTPIPSCIFPKSRSGRCFKDHLRPSIFLSEAPKTVKAWSNP